MIRFAPPIGAHLSLLAAALALGGSMLPVPAQAATVTPPSSRFLFSDKTGKNLSETYRLNHDSAGIPLALDPTLTKVEAALMARIASTLPEQKDIRTQSQNLIASDDAATVQLVKAADVWITFLHEGAGNRNVFGYFTYPEGSPPQSPADIEHIIILPNASYYNSGGSNLGMRTGHRIFLGQFPANTRIGFFVVANGFDNGNGVKWDNNRFYSLSTLNPEATADLRKHMVLLKDSWGQRVVLGMEDLLRSATGCDHDFNDVMFAVESNPVDAIKTDSLVELNYLKGSDLDGDGVPDTMDDYPEDPTMSVRVTYPSSKSRAQLSFEDLWPQEGDYDMNDLVLAYSIDEGRDNAGNVREISGKFQIKARGAGYSHGFGINFPNLPAAALESGSVWIDSQPSRVLTSEPGQPKLTLILFTDSKSLAPKNTNTRTCISNKFNADKNCPEEPGPTIHFRARLKQSYPQAEVGSAPYNPFIYVADRGRGFEIHLPDQPPTALVRTSLLGSSDDGSNPKLGRYYKTKANALPWALNTPVTWPQPYEKVTINTAYASFVDWVKSSGVQATDWFKKPELSAVFPAQ